MPVLTRSAMCRLFPIEREDHAETNREHEDHHGNKDIVTDRTSVVKTEECDTYPQNQQGQRYADFPDFGPRRRRFRREAA
ncbi:hypothetical protein [Sphingomonas immobilis]|uniref:Uncharacterized protein n=1 Tax=Sphingomonas immobilis TaxID=3063997 RepID=A0ABT9A4A8_9SPHN|nr:hypothetical protein [Sphingomonas sp. CA1-15]MDO7844174.1 hypothetical protein [Sphingomonas sp. CA1-15]